MADSPLFAITKQIVREKLFSTRMIVLLPILILFLPGMAWGFSDPDVMLPGGIKPTDTMEVMFFTSLGIVFAATMGGVILSFDGVSRDRDSGVLEIKLSQPIPRTTYSNGIILGHWCSILIPTWALWGISMILVTNRLDDYPSMIVCIEFYKCITDAKVYSQNVHDDFQWVGEESASRLDWLPADIDFVKQMIERGFSSI